MKGMSPATLSYSHALPFLHNASQLLSTLCAYARNPVNTATSQVYLFTIHTIIQQLCKDVCYSPSKGPQVHFSFPRVIAKITRAGSQAVHSRLLAITQAAPIDRV